MEKLLVQNKIKLLFEKLAEPNYVMNNYYVEILINKLSNCTDPEISYLETIPLISDMIVETWDQTMNAHISVKVFLVKLLAIGSAKELHFAKVFTAKNDKIVKAFKDITSPNMNSSLRVAYVEVALGAVEHVSGINWLLKTGVWMDIINASSDSNTVFLIRKIYKFASKFLWKLDDLGDEVNIKQVFNLILSPLSTYDFLNVVSMTREQEEEISKYLEPMLNVLLCIFNEEGRIQEKSLIIGILRNEYLFHHLSIIMDRMRKEDITLMLAKLIFWTELAKVFQNKPLSAELTYSSEDFLELGAIYFNTINIIVQRRSATLAVDYLGACNVIWSRAWGGKSSAIHFNGSNIQNQLIFISVVPCLIYVKKKTISKVTNCGLDEYIQKFLNFVCEHIARAAYSLRDLLLDMDITAVTLRSVKRLTCLKNYLNNEQANLVFQALFYVLREYDPTNCGELEIKEEQFYDDSDDKVSVMTYVLDTILLLLKNFNINWQESLEVICIYTLVDSILKRPNLTCKFVVTALNVLEVTVKKFLTPNLCLLLESKPGSALHDIGKLIYMKIHDLSWEVRDSALELLLVCTEISYIKFAPFQKQIMENNLINVAAAIALNDHEFYVQASALKCLGAATKVNIIWEQLRSQYPNIQELLISILRNNQEGIVRKEACNVLCEMYQNVKLTPTFKQTLYEHMVSSAIGDFHWEVSISALKFFKVVIHSLLRDQGMLDGTFPPVTFSRESRKIVTLNETEIQRRLLKILDELASIGCLTVLAKLLHLDSDIDIMDYALSISLELLEILNSYKVPDILVPKDTEPRTVEEVMCHIKEEHLDNEENEDISDPGKSTQADSVIEGILNADDINLLSKMYERQLYIKKSEDEPPTKPRIKVLKTVSPYLFVTVLKSKDFKAAVEEKKKWKDGIKSLPSLLDDVLGVYEVNNDVNTLDCY